MRDDDRLTSKRESEFSPSYSQLPPREIFVYDHEVTNAPFDAAATPARDNLTTKTTDITEPDIPAAPRMGAKDQKKFNFEVVSVSSMSDDRNDADDSNNKSESPPVGKDTAKIRELAEPKLERVVENGSESSSLLVPNEKEIGPHATKASGGWYFCGGVDESVPYDEKVSKRRPDPPGESQSQSQLPTAAVGTGKEGPPKPESPRSRKRRSLTTSCVSVETSPKSLNKDRGTEEAAADETAGRTTSEKTTTTTSPEPPSTRPKEDPMASPKSLFDNDDDENDNDNACDDVAQAPSDELENRTTQSTECSAFEELCVKLELLLLLSSNLTPSEGHSF